MTQMIKTNIPYEGWTNQATWAVGMQIFNSEPDNKHWMEIGMRAIRQNNGRRKDLRLDRAGLAQRLGNHARLDRSLQIGVRQNFEVKLLDVNWVEVGEEIHDHCLDALAQPA